jgi:2-phospho-L-lactate guanylyltransferase
MNWAILNAALTQAHRSLLSAGCREVLISRADLPRITTEDVDQMVLAARGSALAIAPDAADVGTNALCLVAADSLEFQFGLDSKRLHVQDAARAGFKARIVRRPGLAFDVDTPADLDQIREQQWLPRLRA